MKKIILAIAVAAPFLAQAQSQGQIDSLVSQWCGSVAELAVIQSIRNDGTTPADIASRMLDMMSPGSRNEMFASITLDVLTHAEYQWKGLSQQTVKSLAFSTCKTGFRKHQGS